MSEFKYHFTPGMAGYGCRLWILAPWGDYSGPNLKLIQDACQVMDEHSMWRGCDKVVPYFGDTFDYRVYVKAWEFEAARYTEEKLLALLKGVGITMESTPKGVSLESLCVKHQWPEVDPSTVEENLWSTETKA